MSTTLIFGRDVQGYNAEAPMPSVNQFGALMEADTATEITVPSSSKRWIIQFSIPRDASVWVDFTGDTAVVPTDFSAPVTVCRNPWRRTVLGGSSVSLITADSSVYVGIELYVAGT